MTRTLFRIAAIALLLHTGTAAGSELPVKLADDVHLEEAWARQQPDGLEIFVVINNRQIVPMGPLAVSVGGTPATIVSTQGELERVTIPGHAELYMQPGGVTVKATGLRAIDGLVPVEISIGDNSPVSVQVDLLPDGARPPDHHDYDHG
ncbi:hypothetical protein [Devosia sp. Naph2]|uniref:hypothetical protein n=1 Tax=Devosia polycyclovorans TaxID=3345148 RepID=UPI0035D009D8